MVYKHNKITMPRMKVFQSNAFRLEKEQSTNQLNYYMFLRSLKVLIKRSQIMNTIQNQESYIYLIMKKKIYMVREKFLLNMT